MIGRLIKFQARDVNILCRYENKSLVVYLYYFCNGSPWYRYIRSMSCSEHCHLGHV